MRDVFYYGEKPNIHPKEKFANSLEEARHKSTTDHFWIINEFCNYKNFDWDWDFEFLADNDVWAEEHNNVWPSVHQKDSGTWLCPKQKSEIIIYRADVDSLTRKKEKNSCWWVFPDVDINAFDFSWHPDATDPPFIYAWGSKWNYPVLEQVLTYTVPGATEYKYMPELVKLLPNKNNWEIPEDVDINTFDFSWRPNPTNPPFIYQFGTQWQKTGGPRYIVENATEISYIDLFKCTIKPNKTNWEIHEDVDSSAFDFSWHPDATDPPFIYAWGNKWNEAALELVLTYTVPGATEYNYMPELVKLLPNKTNWEIPEDVDINTFDFTWRPNPTSPPFIYQFGTQWQKTGGPRYIVENATEIAYIDLFKCTIKPNKTNWEIHEDIDDISTFDFSWHPDATVLPFIYEFGTQWQKTGGPRYIVENATEIAYIDLFKCTLIPNKTNWEIPEDVDSSTFDFSWHPDATTPPLIYEFGTQWQKTGGPRYIVENATEISYIDLFKCTIKPNKTNWEIYGDVDINAFDFSWHPDANSPPFIYAWGNKWNEAALEQVVTYTVPGATEYTYMPQLVKLLPNKTNWEIHEDIDISTFDFTWRPNPTSPPFIYEFGTQWQKTGGPRYVVENATEISYIDLFKCTIKPNKTNWKIPEDVDSSAFDFSWHPDATVLPFIYEFGTQWQKTGGPKYIVENATEISYIDLFKCTIKPNKTNWEIPEDVDSNTFDFSWHPDASAPPFIYEFGTQWQKTGGPRYVVENATEISYIDLFKCTIKPNKTNWKIPEDVDINTFDFSWHPDANNPPFIYEFGTQWQKTGGPRYMVENATEISFIDLLKCTIKPNKTNWANWEIHKEVDSSAFDFSWHPDATDPPFIYAWGNKWNKAALEQVVTYTVLGATEYTYMSELVKLLPNKTNWEIPEDVDSSAFDFSWRPNPTSPPFIYQFGTQWQKTGGPRYIVENATEIAYIDLLKCTIKPNKTNWEIHEDVDINSFDFSWHPDASSPPFIYEFGTQWQKTGGPRYVVENATEISYIDLFKCTLIPNKTNWKIPEDVDINTFDFSWHPDPTSPPFIYQFGTQWQKTGGPRYVVENAEEISYVDLFKCTIKPNKTNWEIPEDVDSSTFDFSWHPDANSPPFIYQFGTLLDRDNGPRYIVENATEIVYKEVVYIEKVEVIPQAQLKFVESAYSRYTILTTLEDLIKEHPNELFWALNPDLDYSEFDFDWKPSIEQAQYVHAFGSSESKTTQTYLVNSAMWEKGFRELNWVVDKKLDDETLFKMFKKSDMFFVDRSNNESKARFEKLKQRFPNIQKTRYLNSWVDTINRCINRSTTELCWILNSELDYSAFNFEYYPNPWQMKMIQVFGTQWSHWGTTYLVNRETFAQDTKYIKIIEHLSNLNFVKERKATARNVLYDIIYIDHGNTTMSATPGNIVIKYQGNYIATLQKMLEVLPIKKEHYVWVASTVCDYTDFDFTYICDPFAKEQLHVFPSDGQKFGDTFLVDVNKLRGLIQDMNSLLDYGKINYNQNQRAKRLAAPVFITENDTHITSINTEFNFPYAIFKTSDNIHINIVNTEPISLWSAESKTIEIHSVGGTCITLPKEAKNYIKHELYDYPYILSKRRLIQSAPLDIIFFSNGEQGADLNYEHLLSLTRGLPNKVLRIDKINGRVKSQHAAASSSTSPWYFLVNAKLKVNSKFDFNWQPDRLQIPKHYIFHASNPVNGLEYGHQAIVANNKKLTLANFGVGLDFTMDSEHEVVEINCGVGIYNTSEWDTWRTAFRECIKLKASSTVENIERLERWLSIANGDYAEYSLLGAKNAIEYYETVNGDFDKLRLSYDWMWLKEQFNNINTTNGI